MGCSTASNAWEMSDKVMSTMVVVGTWGLCESIFPDKGDRWILLMLGAIYFLMFGVPRRKRTWDAQTMETLAESGPH